LWFSQIFDEAQSFPSEAMAFFSTFSANNARLVKVFPTYITMKFSAAQNFSLA